MILKTAMKQSLKLVKTCSSSKLVFYAQSTSAVISGQCKNMYDSGNYYVLHNKPQSKLYVINLIVSLVSKVHM